VPRGAAQRRNNIKGKNIDVIKEIKIPRRIQIPLTAEVIDSLKMGDMILLSGEVYTARDVAHRRMYEALLKGETLPIDLSKAVIFYAAPAPTPPGKIIGSIGPTTSYRMDFFTPKLIENGLKGMIGKGNRSEEVVQAIKKNGAVYFGAIGGIAALTAQCIKKVEVIAYDDLGPEAIRKLTIVDFPAVVINDAQGNDLYLSAQREWRIQ
jgi:fumarate hydratase subunit beta